MSAATVILAYGYDLGNPRALGLGWVTDSCVFGEDAGARLERADLPSYPSVDLVPHGFEEAPRWLLVTESKTATAETALRLTYPAQFQSRVFDDAVLRAALAALGLSAEEPASWLTCTYQ